MRLIVKKDDKVYKQFTLPTGPITIGRLPSNIVQLPHRTVSKEHAVIEMDHEGRWVVQDLGSANKTYVKDTAIHKVPLDSGDVIKIACFNLEIQLNAPVDNDDFSLEVVADEEKPFEKIQQQIDQKAEQEFDESFFDEADETVALTHEESLDNQPLPPEFAAADAPAEKSANALEMPEQAQKPKGMHLEASLTNPMHDIVVRKPDAGHAPAMRLAAKRLIQFSKATEKICDCKSLDNLLVTILDLVIEQFDSVHVWCALRDKPGGPMICHAGKTRNNKPVTLDDLILKDKIIQSVEKSQFLVLPRVAPDVESAQRIRSALIATILRPDGCFGVIYADNAMIHDHYSLSDLDYLMLIAIHTAAELKHILNF